jgi:NADH:ubiquinone oxidoreductase subunit H
MLPAPPEPQSGLQALIAAQGEWYGTQWIGFLQPLAAVLWMACTLSITPAAQEKRSLSWQMLKLDRALLTGTLLLGGWQGPLVAQAGWLGLAYTAIKVIALCALEGWLESRRFSLDVPRQARRVWTWYVPLAALNLCLTAGLVALQ